MLFIGIDLGTSAVKLLLVNEAGEILNTVSEEYPLYPAGTSEPAGAYCADFATLFHIPLLQRSTLG